MGYAQELNRSMSKFSNFAVSFTIISILSGCLTLYGYGLLHGGPPVMLWGWLLVGTLVIFAGMSLGEICSAFPTAGGLYYWSAKLAPGKSGPIWSWFTGWFNLLGQVAVTAGISFGCAFSISAFFSILTGERDVAGAVGHHRHPGRGARSSRACSTPSTSGWWRCSTTCRCTGTSSAWRSSSCCSSGRRRPAATRRSSFLFGS